MAFPNIARTDLGYLEALMLGCRNFYRQLRGSAKFRPSAIGLTSSESLDRLCKATMIASSHSLFSPPLGGNKKRWKKKRGKERMRASYGGSLPGVQCGMLT